MTDLKTIKKINSLVESNKQALLAKAMNGRTCGRCDGTRQVLKVAPRGMVVTQKCPDCP